MQGSAPFAARADIAVVSVDDCASWGRLGRLALLAVLGLAATNFLWQLGSSSYFVDEALSIRAASAPLGGLLHAVATTELTPPAYFVFLHEWIGRLGTHEWVARLPSVLCGVLLVAAVYWLASLVHQHRVVALLAATLTALSPFVLEYAQRAQGYVFAMLAVIVAIASAVRATRVPSRRGMWLCAAAAAAVLSLLVHYTAALVIAPLCLWVATRRGFDTRSRILFLASCALAELALVPVYLAQHRANPVRGVGISGTAELTAKNLARVAQTPFDGRVAVLLGLGVAVSAGTLLALLARRRGIVPELRLLTLIAVGEPLALVVLSAVGAELMLSRYAAVAAPVMIVAIATAVVLLPRALGALLLVAALAVSVAGLFASHQAHGFYADARGAIDYVRTHRLAADAVLTPSAPAIAVPLAYYGSERLRPEPAYAWLGSAAAAGLLRQHRRLWVITELPVTTTAAAVLAFEQPGARALGYHAVSARVFPATSLLAVALWTPDTLPRSKG